MTLMFEKQLGSVVRPMELEPCSWLCVGCGFPLTSCGGHHTCLAGCGDHPVRSGCEGPAQRLVPWPARSECPFPAPCPDCLLQAQGRGHFITCRSHKIPLFQGLHGRSPMILAVSPRGQGPHRNPMGGNSLLGGPHRNTFHFVIRGLFTQECPFPRLQDSKRRLGPRREQS